MAGGIRERMERVDVDPFNESDRENKYVLCLMACLAGSECKKSSTVTKAETLNQDFLLSSVSG